MPRGFTLRLCPTCGKAIYTRGFALPNRPKKLATVKVGSKPSDRRKDRATKGAVKRGTRTTLLTDRDQGAGSMLKTLTPDSLFDLPE